MRRIQRTGFVLVLALAGACDDGRTAATGPLAGSSFHNAPTAGADAGNGLLGTAGALGVSGAGAAGIAAAGGEPLDDCARAVHLSAVSLGPAPPFDVIIVADHSASLAWSRMDLARGLSTLLADVRGHDARFFVLTPTQYGASSAAAINQTDGSPLVQWQDPVSGEAFTPAMTRYEQRCEDPAGAPITCPAFMRGSTLDYRVQGSWGFVMPDPVAILTRDMDDAAIAAQQDAIASAILALQGTGSPHEQPLCTLNRYLLDNPQTLPSRAVFLILSDEDDTSTAEQCAVSYEYERKSDEVWAGELCFEDDCETYQFLVNRSTYRRPIRFSCVPVNDLGDPLPEGSFDRMTWLNGTLAACTGETTTAACSGSPLDWARDTCGPGHIVQDCQSNCEPVEQSGCVLMTTATNPQYCSGSFTHDGTTYASIFDYCDMQVGDHEWLGCERRGYRPGIQRYATHRITGIVPGDDTEALIQSFIRSAQTAFTPDGFFVGVIGFDPTFDCQPAQGQSHATNLRRITTDQQDVFPICGDYATALDRIRGFTQTLLASEHPLELAIDERIASVRVRDRSGLARPLAQDAYSYDRMRALLILQPTAIGPADVGLDVEIDKTCVVQPD